MTRIGNLIRDPAELKSRGVQLERLALMSERVTKDDLQAAARAMFDCATDISYLLRSTPIGCPCRLVENDGYSYANYVDECVHHGQYKRLLGAQKKAYEDAERKLQDTLRTKFAMSALAAAGAGDGNTSPEVVVRRAFHIADAMIAALSTRS